MKYLSLFLCFLLANIENIVSQNVNYHFKHYNIHSNLSQNTVMAICQDSKGFIWLGTKNGLNRFDGHDFKIYLRGENQGSLRNSMICCIVEDCQKNLWIGTDQGISIYNPFTDTFSDFDLKTAQGKSIENAVNKIAIDHKNRVWILAGPDLYIHIPQEQKLYHLNEKFKAPYAPTAFFVDNNDIAYICFPHTEIISYDFDNNRQTSICPLDNIPTCISEYQDGQLLYGSINRGVHIVNKETGIQQKVLINDIPESNIYVRAIEKISDNEYWVGSENGIYILKDNTIEHLGHEDFNIQSLSDNAIYSIFKDRENGIWIGSYFGGVDYIPPTPYLSFENIYPIAYKNSVSGYRVREMVYDPQGNLWIATEDKGLNYYDTKNKTFTHITPQSRPLHISFTNIQCLNLTGQKLWIGTFSKGIDVLDLKTNQCRHYEKTGQEGSIDNNDIFAIFTDCRNTTWIGTSSSVYTYVPETDNFKRFSTISGVFISDIKEDKSGNIWFATYNRGLIKFHPESGTIQNFRYDKHNPQSLCYDRITCIFEDSRQQLWFGSEDGGFCRYDSSNNTFLRITAQQGLPSNVVYSIVEDDNHHLWLSTNNGLVDFDPQTMSMKAYNISDGLQSRQFNYNSGIKGSDGTLYFGSINGFVAFNPQNFYHNDTQYPVVLTDFYLFNDEVKVDSTGILDKSIPYAETIRLNYDQSTFSIRFSSLNYGAESEGKYAYQLAGIDQNWNYTDKMNQISYNSIPPGNYTFRIKYSKDGHQWSNTDTQIRIQITPPIWQTPWAYAIYTLIIFGMLFTAFKIYTSKKKKQMKEQLEHQEQMKKEEIYNAKISFFTNIAHEIRTPITLIKAPLDYILSNRLEEGEIKENLVTMERNTDRLLILVNQLLDFRKIESKAFTLSLQVKDINTLITNVYIRFIPTARQKHLDMTLECPAQAIKAYVDEEAITKICSNLFTNAIKYAATYIKIILSEHKDPHYLQLTVRNDGPKIPANLKQNIFEAFFQIKNNEQPAQPGSGIGLTLANSLVQLHNGKLYLDDQAEDNLFIMQIPIHFPEGISEEQEKEKQIQEVEMENTGKEYTEKQEIITPMQPDSIQKNSLPGILVVEDNEELRNFIVQQLSKQYRIFAAGNGIEALEILKKNIINLIVSDVMMPLMNGLELCSHIKSNIEICHIPVILLTAKTTLENKIEGLECGADAYIEKPFAMPHLSAQIKNLLDNRAKLRQNFVNDPYITTNSIAQNKADEDFLNKLTEIIQKNLDDATFNIDNLASEIGMSRTSLHRKIKGITEFTPGDFIRVIRLKKAAELLLEGEYRINEICAMIGIQSLSYFSKCFQKQFGMTPKEFAKNKGKQKSVEENNR